MSRQVDVKALVSHIVKGDGADRCRICLGDTTEGQVYLGDTVMKDGDKAFTLAELLQVITGVQVSPDDELPSGLCPTCSHSAINAVTFLSLCKKSAEHWDMTVRLLDSMPEPTQFIDKKYKSIYAVLSDNILTIIDGSIDEDSKSQYGDDFQSDLPYDAPIDPVDKRQKGRKRNILRKSSIDGNYESQYREDFQSKPSYNSLKDPAVKRRRRTKGIECQCPECGKKFKRPQLLYQHLMDSKDYRQCCHICAALLSKDELVIHLEDVHKTEPFCCERCPALFQSESQLRRHLEKVHTPGAYTCGECGHTFKTSSALHGHMSAHSIKNCPKCDKLFLNHPCYVHHVPICCKLPKNNGTHHTKNKVVYEIENKDNKKIKVGPRGSADSACICDYCGKTFAGKKFVCAHIQIVHMKNTHRPCPYCGKSFAAANMTVHITTHKEKTKFTCKHCGIVLKSKLGYIQHIRLHTGEKPYKCAHCPEKFSSSSRRSEHVQKVHSTGPVYRHTCHLCPAKFRLPYKLKKHLSEAHVSNDGDPVIEFECPECHIKFGSCRSLLHHSKKHEKFSLKPTKKTAVET